VAAAPGISESCLYRWKPLDRIARSRKARTPAVASAALAAAHCRIIRHDRVDKSGTVTLRVAGRLRHIGIGRTPAGTHIILLVEDLQIRIVNAATGELLRELILDPTRDYQPTGRPPGPTPK